MSLWRSGWYTTSLLSLPGLCWCHMPPGEHSKQDRVWVAASISGTLGVFSGREAVFLLGLLWTKGRFPSHSSAPEEAPWAEGVLGLSVWNKQLWFT